MTNALHSRERETPCKASEKAPLQGPGLVGRIWQSAQGLRFWGSRKCITCIQPAKACDDECIMMFWAFRWH